jgi:hypothetical protein
MLIVLHAKMSMPLNFLPFSMMTNFESPFIIKKWENTSHVIMSELTLEMNDVEANLFVLHKQLSITFWLHVLVLTIQLSLTQVPYVHAQNVEWFFHA